MNQFNILPLLIVRTPNFSYARYNIKNCPEIIKDSNFQLALYIANPAFYNFIKAKDFNWAALNDKEQLTIAKYYNRMSFRTTPFGAFSSTSIAEWSQTGEVCELGEVKLHVIPDQELLINIHGALPDSQHGYIINSTLYKAYKDFRFVKTSFDYVNSKAFYSLDSYEYNSFSKKLVGFLNEVKPKQILVDFLLRETGFNKDEAQAYIDFLLDAQLMIAAHHPYIIGPNQLPRLSELYSNEALLADAFDKFQGLTSINLPQVSTLADISATLNNWLVEKNLTVPKNYYYANSEQKVFSGGVDARYQQQLLKAAKILNYLSQPSVNGQMDTFIERFRERYEQKKVSLLSALDPDLGIGYADSAFHSDQSPLLKDISFTNLNSTCSLQWSPAHQLLLQAWTQQRGKNIYDPISLTYKKLQEDIKNNDEFQSPSFPIVFRIVDNRVIIDNAGGVTGTAIMGRFNLFSDTNWELGKTLAKHEQTANPDIVFAELGQLSDPHVDNINRRRPTYDFEIPINSRSVLSSGNVIALSDLVISLKGNDLILESVSKHTRVIPRLTTAYNYQRNDLAIFRFLCDMQYQGLQCNLSFDLETYFPGQSFYPRVEVDEIIISLATWHLTKDNLLSLQTKDLISANQNLNQVKQQLHWPDLIALTRHDQQLIFNLNDDNERAMFLKSLSGLNKAVIQEYFLPDAHNALVKHEGQPVNSQMIAFFYFRNQIFNPLSDMRQTGAKNIKRKYMLGSEWLYLKIYCTPSSSDYLLTTKVFPLINRFMKNKMYKWFFIRYSDAGGYHLRLRMKVKDQYIGDILNAFRRNMDDSLKCGVIHNYQADIYFPELERYGPQTMSETEDVFFTSSSLVAAFLERTRQSPEHYPDYHLALISVYYMTALAYPDRYEQEQFLKTMANQFYVEFSTDKALRVELDTKYREMREEILHTLSSPNHILGPDLMQLFTEMLNSLKELIDKVTVTDTDKKTQLMADLIHMHLNRTFKHKQRRQEMVTYYLASKFCISQIAQLTKKTQAKAIAEVE